jgi:copper(I)-binding protein
MKRVLWFLLAGMLLVTSCDTGAEMEVREPWARPAAQGDNGAVYMILHNHASTADELVGASADVAQAVEIHESTIDANGVMQMARRSSILFSAGEEVEFRPGGLHIMLIRLKRDLTVGDEIKITLHFKNREDIILAARVLDSVDMDGHVP